MPTADKPTPIFAVSLDAALRVRAFVSKEETRYYLNGVCIEPAPEGAVCAATDGHRLGARYDRQGWCAESVIVRLPAEVKMPPGKLIVSPWLVGVRTAPGKGHISVVQAASKADQEDTAQFAIERLEECSLRIGNAFIDGTFPDWRRVIPQPREGDAIRGFNSDYVKGFGRGLAIRGSDAAAPHLIKVEGESDFIGVLMPMRVEAIEKLPEWLARPETVERKKAA